METPTTPISKTQKIIALSGIFFGLIIAMALTVFLVPRGVNYLASVSLSSVFTPKEEIILTPSKRELISDEILVLSWNGPIRQNGVYSLSYPCKENISATIAGGQPFNCDTPFFFSTATNTAIVSFVSNRAVATDIPLYLNFKDTSEETSIVGDTLVTIAANRRLVVATTTETTVKTPAKTPTPTKTVTPPKTTYNTNTTKPTDLVARVLSIGYINSTNTFTPGTHTPEGSRPALRFEVINAGGLPSGSWSFKAILPSNTTPVYLSPLQRSLSSGDRIEFTLGFDSIPNGGDVTISVNDNKTVSESNYINNIINYRLSAGSGSISQSPSNGTISYPTSYDNTRDLSVTIKATGYINNGQFVSAPSITGSQRAGIVFTVRNTGGAYSGPWNFKATLPSRIDKTYSSKTMDSLAPGASVDITIGFDYIEKVGQNTAVIMIDPSNSIAETNESNNTAPVIITATSY